MLPQDCQIQGVPRMADEEAEGQTSTLSGRVKILLKRHVPHQTKRQIKKLFNLWLSRDGRQSNLTRIATDGAKQPSQVAAAAKSHPLKAGDLVRVRPYEEIAVTLDRWGELKGCGFMTDMQAYCGTTQRVFKPVERVVDERDYRVKKCRGVVLLEGLICCGTATFGHCDRSCFYFWREEWLEKVG